MNHKLPPFHITLAGVCIAIHPRYDYIQEYCKDYLCTPTPSDAAFTVAVTDADIAYEEARSAADDRKLGIPVRRFPPAYLETLAVYRKIAAFLLDHDILLFHGSCVAVDGVGYLFTAKSGTGKSTHVQLWQERFGSRAVMINDDKPLLRITDIGVTAFGTPWDGKHRRSTNTSVPLRAICILSRSADNHIEKIAPGDAYSLLLQQTYRPADPTALTKTLTLLDRMLRVTDFYRLGCNMDPEAAQVSYEGMQPEI